MEEDTCELSTLARHSQDAELLRQLAGNPNEEVQLALAANPACPEDVVRQLHRRNFPHRYWAEPWRLASNPATPEDLLAVYFSTGGECYQLVGEVARNPGLPRHLVLAVLGRVRLPPYGTLLHLAANPCLQGQDDLLWKVCREAEYERDYSALADLADRGDLPEELERHLARSKSEGVRRNIAVHTRQEAVLAELAQDYCAPVRRGVAWNKAVPREVLERLVFDQNLEVARAAQRNAQELGHDSIAATGAMLYL